MKFTNLKATSRAGALALILTLMAFLPTFAQNNSRNDNVRTDDRRPETTRVVEQDNDTDCGWLGLLGLLGLAGLLPKKRSIEVKGVRDGSENRPVS